MAIPVGKIKSGISMICLFWVPEKPMKSQSEERETDGLNWLFFLPGKQRGFPRSHAGKSGGTTGHWTPAW